mmetsp:Transcript_5623/g.12343  ORF Transcript_5623/g.12343 Transcript_5623/m.12343 type:complete len:457 (+) Transcript_5623:43-1413(+)
MALLIQKKASLYAPYRDRDSDPQCLNSERTIAIEEEDEALKEYGLNCFGESGYTWTPETHQDHGQLIWPWKVDLVDQIGWERNIHHAYNTYEEWRNEGFIIELRQGIAYCTMNESFNNNAFSGTIVSGFTNTNKVLRERHDIRVAVLAGNGRMFCSGGDPKGFQAEQRAAGAIGGDASGGGGHQFTPEQIAAYQRHMETRADAESKGFYMDNPKFYEICGIYSEWDRLTKQGCSDNTRNGILGAYHFYSWATLPQFTICCKHGSSMGGALGILAGSDYCVAVKTAFATLSEVRLGVIPAVVSNHVIRGVGPSNALRIFATAENLNMKNALELGLVQRVIQSDKEYPGIIKEICEKLDAVSPDALRYTKKAIFNTINRPMSGQMMDWLAREYTRVRKSPQCEEGMANLDAGNLQVWVEKKIDCKENSYKAEIWWSKPEEDKKKDEKEDEKEDEKKDE